MEKSATDIMQEVLTSTVLDAIVAWKQASGGLPNVLARDLGAVHQNTTPADLPKEVQAAIQASVRTAFNKLLKEGYAVAKGQPQRSPFPPRPDGPPRGGPGGSRGPQRLRSGGRPPVVEVKRPPRTPRDPKGDK